jgi:hypothetical protein
MMDRALHLSPKRRIASYFLRNVWRDHDILSSSSPASVRNFPLNLGNRLKFLVCHIVISCRSAADIDGDRAELYPYLTDGV